MSARGVELLEIMDGQIAGLTDLLRERGEVALKLPCPGRANMADGTVGAVAAHTADRYQQIAGFLHAANDASRNALQPDHHEWQRAAGDPANGAHTYREHDIAHRGGPLSWPSC